ncbi:MAG: hypothetical protein IJ507_10655 [Clostridia bacterium]|nr:hypothetical protein [Clostridia bacterium]
MKKTFWTILTALLLVAAVSLAEGALLRAAGAEEAADAAVQVALAHAGEDAQADLVLPGREDGKAAWTVLLIREGAVLEYEISADGRVLEADVYASGGMTPSQIIALLQAEKGLFELKEADVDMDDGRLILSGEAEMDGKRYEFEALMLDGTLLEWERD